MTIKGDKDTDYKVKSLFNCKLITNIQGYDHILTESIISYCIIVFHKTIFRVMHLVLELTLRLKMSLTNFRKWVW